MEDLENIYEKLSQIQGELALNSSVSTNSFVKICDNIQKAQGEIERIHKECSKKDLGGK